MEDETEAQKPSSEANEVKEAEKNPLPTSDGTDTKAGEVQSDGQNTDGDDDEDPIEAYKKTFEETKAAKLREELLEQIRKEEEERQNQAREIAQANERRERAKSSFADTAKTVAEKVKSLKVYDEDGNPVIINEQEFIEPWNTYNITVHSDKEAEVYSSLAQAVVDNLPTDARDEFAKRADRKPLNEYLKIANELYAPKSEYVKRLEDDYKEKIAAAEARGFAKGQKSRSGTVIQGAERSTPPSSDSVDLTTISGAASALAKGLINDEKYREVYRKLRG